MHQFSRAAAPAIFAVCVAMFLLSGCGQKAPTAVKVQTLPVTTITVQPQDENYWIETVGEVEGNEQTEIIPQVSGMLKKIAYKEGDSVKAGQVLFVIDESTYRAAYDDARASAQQAQATLAQARREAKRNEDLYKNKAVSQKVRDDAVSTYHVAEASLAAAQAKERSAAIDLARTKVTAPSAGIVSKAEVNLGTLVSASSTVLAHLTQPNALRVNFQAADRDLAGNEVTLTNSVRLQADGSNNWIPANLDYVATQVNSATATLGFRANVSADSGLRPGQFVHVQLAGRVLKDAFRVPQAAVMQKPDGTYQIYLYNQGKAKAVTVQVGPWQDKDWIVTSGLKAGDQVITDQLQRLKDGAAVKIAADKKTAS